MRTIIITVLFAALACLAACADSGGENGNEHCCGHEAAFAGLQPKTFGLQAAEDALALYEAMLEKAPPMLTREEAGALTGIEGSTERYEGSETQKDLVDYEYGGGARITVAYFEGATVLSLHVDDEKVFTDAGIASPDLSALGLESGYWDYARAIGEQGVLVGFVGSVSITFMWVNSEGLKLEATFSWETGNIIISHDYWWASAA